MQWFFVLAFIAKAHSYVSAACPERSLERIDFCFVFKSTFFRQQSNLIPTAKPRGCESLNRIRGGRIQMSDPHSSNASLTFYTNQKCPFAQRVWIALEEKCVEYKPVEIGLYGSGGKPSWFMQLNPKGEVPVIKHNESIVIDSSNIIRQVLICIFLSGLE